MAEYGATAREQIVTLLGMKLGREISHDTFRVAFEELFNFKLQRDHCSPAEFAVFERLFDTVVWYSPIPDDRNLYPQYKSARELEEAVEAARRDLGLMIGESTSHDALTRQHGES